MENVNKSNSKSAFSCNASSRTKTASCLSSHLAIEPEAQAMQNSRRQVKIFRAFRKRQVKSKNFFKKGQEFEKLQQASGNAAKRRQFGNTCTARRPVSTDDVSRKRDQSATVAANGKRAESARTRITLTERPGSQNCT